MKYSENRIMVIPGDTVILREGEVNLDMYKIIQGNVELYSGYQTDQEVLLGILGKDACFGEFGLLLRKPAIYTAVTYSEVQLLRVTEGELGDFVSENQEDVIDIMRNMSRMMMAMQQQIDLLSEDVAELGGKIDENGARHNLRAYTMNNDKPFKVGMSGKMHYFGYDR